MKTNHHKSLSSHFFTSPKSTKGNFGIKYDQLITEIEEDIDLDSTYWAKYHQGKETEDAEWSKEKNIMMGIKDNMELNKRKSPSRMIDRIRVTDKVYRTLFKDSSNNNKISSRRGEWFTSRLKANRNQLKCMVKDKKNQFAPFQCKSNRDNEWFKTNSKAKANAKTNVNKDMMNIKVMSKGIVYNKAISKLNTNLNLNLNSTRYGSTTRNGNTMSSTITGTNYDSFTSPFKYKNEKTLSNLKYKYPILNTLYD